MWTSEFHEIMSTCDFLPLCDPTRCREGQVARRGQSLCSGMVTLQFAGDEHKQPWREGGEFVPVQIPYVRTGYQISIRATGSQGLWAHKLCSHVPEVGAAQTASIVMCSSTQLPHRWQLHIGAMFAPTQRRYIQLNDRTLAGSVFENVWQEAFIYS
jgi:hypothetical protein